METAVATESEHDALQKVARLISDQELSSVASRYEAALEKQNADIGFNLFELISDYYYRETFHSDILYGFLDPNGKHDEQDKYLRLFLKFIQKWKPAINLADYEDAEVEKEKGRVDILILGKGTIFGKRKAVIVENKINNAPDQKKQLPRYLKDVTEVRGCECDAIIYLRLNGTGGPSPEGWNDEDVKEWAPKVRERLIVIPAYESDEAKNDLLRGWIYKCKEKSSENREAYHILHQYGEIIRKLGGNIVNRPIMEEFYKIITEGENLKTAVRLDKMLKDLIRYRVDKIIDKFTGDETPFSSIRPDGDGADGDGGAFFVGLSLNSADFQIYIAVGTESYCFIFQDGNDRPGKDGRVKEIVQRMNYLDGVFLDGEVGGLYTKEFKFPSQENDLYEYISVFKKKLAAAIAGK